MKKFTLGVATGMASLSLAVPMIAQLVGAQATGTAATDEERPVPTQACLNAMVALEDAQIASVDTLIAARKKAMQERRDALAEVAQIADDGERQDALRTMHEEMHAQRDTFEVEVPQAISTAMDAVKTACNDTFGGKRHGFMKMKFGGSMHGMRGAFIQKIETDSE